MIGRHRPQILVSELYNRLVVEAGAACRRIDGICTATRRTPGAADSLQQPLQLMGLLSKEMLVVQLTYLLERILCGILSELQGGDSLV